ncbi:hypothetical protein FA15DRAFT_757577 [Coprinopsis marcescibilis]|uniref:Uncharacterized protein n=1 Tax=Coprinopsis marcescibilis TaxID=230819 RepID=A0A5C3KT69_COPMA|nr:hypothetical protein FA15DRAFT_757577 [Coprinopsis marcescibilis]
MEIFLLSFFALLFGLASASKWTWGETNFVGVCGKYINETQFAIAVSEHVRTVDRRFRTSLMLVQQDFDGGRDCNRRVVLEWGGVTRKGTILDLCTECAPGDIRLTRHFWGSFLLGPDEGPVLDGSWSFASQLYDLKLADKPT